MSPHRRFGVVANTAALLIGLVLAVNTGSGTSRGFAESDDLPYGDLVALDRSGALVWTLLAAAGLAASQRANTTIRRLAGVAWAGLAVLAAAVVVAEGDLLGLVRPGTAAAAAALALATAVPAVAEARTR